MAKNSFKAFKDEPDKYNRDSAWYCICEELHQIGDCICSGGIYDTLGNKTDVYDIYFEGYDNGNGKWGTTKAKLYNSDGLVEDIWIKSLPFIGSVSTLAKNQWYYDFYISDYASRALTKGV